MKQSRWYAIRTKPGYQRSAATMEDRPGEMIVERNLRREGVDVYVPSYWSETIHHRKKVWLEKRYPLLVGYCFVNLPEQNFEEVRTVDGVMCFLRGGRNYGPIQFSETIVANLMLADFEARQAYQIERQTRIAEETDIRVKKLRSDLRRMLPKGRAIRASMVDQAEAMIDRLPERSRERVRAIVAELNGLTNNDMEKVA